MNKIQRIAVSILAKIHYRNKCIIERDAIVYGKCTFEGKNKISPGAHVTHSKLGYASYVGKNSIFTRAIIGRFCSIGDDVKLVSATHPIEVFASTHPAFYSTTTLSSFVSEKKFDDLIIDKEGISIRIGNDVWIGNNTLLKAGITIGDGAVIAMGAVVTKDVPPYSVVGGVPAQIIRYRYTEEVRSQLLKTKWWSKDIQWIERNAALFEHVKTLLSVLSDGGKDSGIIK